MPSKCIECFYLKNIEKGKQVRCDEEYFYRLPPDHPFVTQERNCPMFDADPYKEDI